VQGEQPDSGGSGRLVARIAGVGALVIAAILVAMLLFGGEEGYKYDLRFETGGQLVPGNQVLVGGQPIGIVDEITLTDDAQAEVAITVDDPLHEGTTAIVRSTSLSGIANRYISVAPGPNSNPELPSGGLITAEDTTTPVDLDQLFNTLDEPTRQALQDVIKGQATIYTGNTEAARETYKYFAPGLQATQRLLAELTGDQAALSRFLVDGSTALGAIADRRDDLAALTTNANQALGAIAERNEELDRALVALPPTLRQGNTTFVNLRAALDDLDPLIADLGDVAPDLPPFLRKTAATADEGVPVFRDLTEAIATPGQSNDLTDSLRALPGAQHKASKSVEPTITALNAAQPDIALTRAYAPDLLRLLGSLGQSTAYYDANGHFARVMPAGANLFSNAGGTLTPIAPAQQFDQFSALGLGPFTRCPGSSTQANAGWPTPPDHPFLDGGSLTGDCDPSQVPPGP
jgi:phospholipid/cholesterol/gamma-HCH transport system substrate-binding protein